VAIEEEEEEEVEDLQHNVSSTVLNVLTSRVRQR
jgi:hypothetical protein